MKILKTAAFACSSLLIAGAAQAANITCSGNYLGYNFNLTARSLGTRLSSNINLVVRGSDGSVRRVSLKPQTSDIRPGSYLRFSGASSDGSGTLSANFDAGSRLYRGVLSAQSPTAGSATVDVSCTLNGARASEPDFGDSGEPFFSVIIPELQN